MGGLTVAAEELPCLDDCRVAGEGVGHAELCVVVADRKAKDWRRDGQRRGGGNNEGKDSVGQHLELLSCSWRKVIPFSPELLPDGRVIYT